MMNDRDELLQERLAQLAAGEPLERLLDGLSTEEADSLRLAADMGAMRFEQDETAVAAQRLRLLDAARRQLATARPGRAASSILARLQTWISQRPTYRGAALGIAGLLLIALLGSIWLGRQQSGKSDLENSLASGTAATGSTQEIDQETELSASTGSGSEAVETSEQPVGAVTGDHPAEVAAADSVYQVFVPVADQALQQTADQAVLKQPRGLVEVATADGDWVPVTRVTLLEAGYFVRTGRLSSASLTFYDGSQARLGPDSQVYIDQLDAQRPQDGFRTVVLAQQFGETTHSVQFRNDAGSLYQVKTPTGSGIARGTQFRVRVDDDAQASYAVTEGKVDVSNASRTVSVVAGQQTSFAPDEAPLAPEFWVVGNGFVTQTGDDAWIIAGQTFSVTLSTNFVGNPDVGDFVHVDGHLDDDGYPVADAIQLLWTSPEDTFTLTGIVGSIGDTWMVAGQTISVTEDTVQDPGISVGSLVRVSGTIQQPDGLLVAETIVLLNTVDEMPFEFVGITESITPNWRVSGIDLQLAVNVEIDDGIEVGDIVKVEGIILEDGTWLAEEIELLQEQQATFEFTGEVTTIGALTWTVAGISFEVDTFTQIEEGIAGGDIVHVSGIIQVDGTWLARSIELVDDSLLEIVFVGIVDDNSSEPWTISGLPIFTAGAEIDPGIEAGNLVRVTAIIQADNTWLATRIELLSAEVPVGCVTITAVVTGLSEDRVFLSNGQTILLNGIVIDGELSVNSVVAIVACANADGTIDIISITVIYVPVQLPPSPDDDDRDGDDGGQEGRVTICHKPGTPAEKTMSLPRSALGGHLGHGDSQGACP